MSDPTSLSLWIGGVLEAPGKEPTEFIGWKEHSCCGGSQPDLYLSGRHWSVIIDSPWVLTNPDPDVILVHGWAIEPVATLKRSSS